MVCCSGSAPCVRHPHSTNLFSTRASRVSVHIGSSSLSLSLSLLFVRNLSQCGKRVRPSGPESSFFLYARFSSWLVCVCVECDFGELLSRVIRESEREEANRVRLLWMESGGGRDARVLRRSCLPFSSTL